MTLPAGRELDAEVAKKVMGLVPCQSESHIAGGKAEGWLCFATPENPDAGAECPSYSTSIADAWAVVEKMRERGLYLDLRAAPNPGPKAWGAEFPEAYSCDLDYAETAPLAICRAALAALSTLEPKRTKK